MGFTQSGKYAEIEFSYFSLMLVRSLSIVILLSKRVKRWWLIKVLLACYKLENWESRHFVLVHQVKFVNKWVLGVKKAVDQTFFVLA